MIPNLITLCRLALVPFVIAMMSKGEFRAAFYGFMLAGLSDAIDGYIARRFDMRTELGAYLDAIADKVLLMPEGTSLEAMRRHYPLLIDACKRHGHRLSPRLHIELFGNKRGT